MVTRRKTRKKAKKAPAKRTCSMAGKILRKTGTSEAGSILARCKRKKRKASKKK